MPSKKFKPDFKRPGGYLDTPSSSRQRLDRAFELDAFDDSSFHHDEPMDEDEFGDASQFANPPGYRTPDLPIPQVDMKRRSDNISSAPGKRFSNPLGIQEKVQRSQTISLYKSLKGVGFSLPGNPFSDRSRLIKHDFSFDLSASRSSRQYTTTLWRHGEVSYVDTDTQILSPAQTTTPRYYDAVACNTAVRDGSGTRLYSSTSLWDLEQASWNAKALKFNFDPTANYTINGTPAIVSLGVYADCQPTSDHNAFTPFPAPSATTTPTTQTRAPFLVSLGTGSVLFNVQNKFPTNCEVEFVVYQIRESGTGGYAPPTDYLDNRIIDYCNTSITRKLQAGPTLTSSTTGSGGQILPSTFATSPDYKFLDYSSKFMSAKNPGVERHRLKFVLSGGSLKSVKFIFPKQIYESNKNRSYVSSPFVSGATGDSETNPQSYAIFIAINGSIMPVFTAPIANTTNGVTVQDYVNTSVVDRQTCAASVMITGSYEERPLPCIYTKAEMLYNNFPLMYDTTLSTTVPTGTGLNAAANFVLQSGYVNSGMPVPVSSGNVTSYAGPVGSVSTTVANQEKIGD